VRRVRNAFANSSADKAVKDLASSERQQLAVLLQHLLDGKVHLKKQLGKKEKVQNVTSS
jgi:hypothetical protein